VIHPCLADRAKSIKTVAKVNQAATDKLIQELIREREQLLKELESKSNKGLDEEEKRRLQAEYESEVSGFID
jgi:hypothetical protein